MDKLLELMKNNTKSSLVVAGDFNARDIDWDTLLPTTDCSKKTSCNKLISILGEAGLHQMHEKTRDRMPYWIYFALTSLLLSKQ